MPRTSGGFHHERVLRALVQLSGQGVATWLGELACANPAVVEHEYDNFQAVPRDGFKISQ